MDGVQAPWLTGLAAFSARTTRMPSSMSPEKTRRPWMAATTAFSSPRTMLTKSSRLLTVRQAAAYSGELPRQRDRSVVNGDGAGALFADLQADRPGHIRER